MDIFLQYERAIDWIVAQCPEPDKFAHTYAGIAIWFLAALWSRKPLYSLWTLVPVIGLELANETMDRFAHGAWFWPDTLRDMAATWFWPVVMVGLMRLFPSLTGRPLTGDRPSEPIGLAPAPQHEIESPMPSMPPVRAPDRHDVGSVLAGGEPV
ncbi:hypothetical protein [Novosphingobium mangrovi (ex Huang et al. 2023)]|uniref:Transmembrane protein n=1 Tax=Novosphingobium mangrovi (ex Huang et al. 2023) TaxID=2976432 RepID=A0ABT2I398_9SPHN|nr:hypothetical protein [Novosphingobium mangrovi (ex Huang et al. 2023)]MCT2399072.1 hypothetical protein [Novosphingobium mangrovi (ex Huang et al. 2023)]